MFLVPGLRRRIRTQQFMIELTNSLDRRLQFLIIGTRAANLINALAPEAGLPRPSTGRLLRVPGDCDRALTQDRQFQLAEGSLHTQEQAIIDHS